MFYYIYRIEKKHSMKIYLKSILWAKVFFFQNPLPPFEKSVDQNQLASSDRH